jgi:uncharacterized heparinase superfamily protein
MSGTFSITITFGWKWATVSVNAMIKELRGSSRLSFFRCALKPWHGGQPTKAQMQRLAPKPTDAARRRSGFQRMTAAKTIVIMDAGPPPPARENNTAHASTLAITMSDGPRNLLVSCGGERGPAADGARAFPPELALGLRSTAGHCALILADTNSTRLVDGGQRKAGGVEEVLAESRCTAEAQWIEARHDGYRKRFGYDHLRRLYLAADGHDLRGEDQLLPSKTGLPLAGRREPLPVAIRFHLGAGCEATLTQDGRGALIKLPASRPQDRVGWGFRVSFKDSPGKLSIEPSLMIDSEGELHQIQQLLLVTEANDSQPVSIGWSFRRQGRS